MNKEMVYCLITILHEYGNHIICDLEYPNIRLWYSYNPILMYWYNIRFGIVE